MLKLTIFLLIRQSAVVIALPTCWRQIWFFSDRRAIPSLQHADEQQQQPDLQSVGLAQTEAVTVRSAPHRRRHSMGTDVTGHAAITSLPTRQGKSYSN